MEPESGAVMMISVADGSLAKSSCFEKVRAPKADELGALKLGSEAMVRSHENYIDIVLSQTPCLKKNRDTEDIDVKICNCDNRMGPETPFPDRETLEPSDSSDKTEEDFILGCQTPSESIFDPFAPGPEELAFAPKKKMMKGTQYPLRRQLNFDIYDACVKNLESNITEDAEEEDRFVELVCKSFLDLIISNQLKEISDQMFLSEPSPSECFKTPTSTPILCGIADTCPAAPLRQTLKSKRVGQGICRKLDFGSNIV
ncbi:uncharacterized protein [Typha angustifolia]|uniref:uncharacterized protein n=1 Tax=Typha angustifolia TaxID=59011 RepID=UPI003C2FABE6